jgi:hypothetical protein
MVTEIRNVITACHSVTENGVKGHSQEKCDTALLFTTSWTLEKIFLCVLDHLIMTDQLLSLISIAFNKNF